MNWRERPDSPRRTSRALSRNPLVAPRINICWRCDSTARGGCWIHRTRVSRTSRSGPALPTRRTSRAFSSDASASRPARCFGLVADLEQTVDEPEVDANVDVWIDAKEAEEALEPDDAVVGEVQGERGGDARDRGGAGERRRELDASGDAVNGEGTVEEHRSHVAVA